MAKTDWGLNDIVKPADLNELGGEVNQLREDVDNINFPISDATDGTRSDVAGSEKAVGLVMAEAQAAKTAGNERKSEVVAALVALGVSASTSDTWATLISKMTAIIKATGNATAADVLAGKTASNANGPITGTMPNRGAGGTVTPGTTNQTKAAGYYSSPITILGDADLVPGNIKSGVNLFGVLGSLIEGKPFATGTTNSSSTGSTLEVRGLSFAPTVFIYRSLDSSFLNFWGFAVSPTSTFMQTSPSWGASGIGYAQHGGQGAGTLNPIWYNDGFSGITGLAGGRPFLWIAFGQT
ncbi:hypothetical protein [Paenibacillus apis]|uniref:Tail fiber protein n=1 Tax=Paenibacillus apis TaxID=1792174 RepID=A0A920CKE8_9BACL|nr:hypothetical protein [Paenibacillus apis]GIO42460.1 hypothetical protein J41TS4_22180 [Paenibacillus apis]